ncbi:hypothetical protein JXD20_01265 [Candidatus Peregrinibacteria bacterium]|nr:hypothetical protein [Candidatus Peregrinibacteria bacterium]
MGLSILVAKILALLYLSAGVAALGGKITFAKIVDDFEKSPALTFMTGLFSITVGMLMVEYHNIWVKDWPVLITIIGWAALIKGVMFIAWPQKISFFKPWYKKTQVWGILMIAIGLLFGYLGFFL